MSENLIWLQIKRQKSFWVTKIKRQWSTRNLSADSDSDFNLNHITKSAKLWTYNVIKYF